MRFERPRYPVDRYLVESSNKVEMVNITEDDIWNPEPALRPEDEIILRKLHEMLQSTADDLKLLSGELSKHHEPGVQVKMLPTPLDEEFNEKVHIEEVVNAKFHGHKIIDSSQYTLGLKPNKPSGVKASLPKSIANAYVQVDSIPSLRKPSTAKKLEISRTKVIEIDQNNTKASRLNNAKAATLNCNEFCYKYVEPKENVTKKNLNVQTMPSINIRSELTKHKVLHLDILPETKEDKLLSDSNTKIAVITMQHEATVDKQPLKSCEWQNPHATVVPKSIHGKIRKVSKMSTSDSSSTNINSYSPNTNNPVKEALKSSSKIASRIDNGKTYKMRNKKSSDKKCQSNLEQWKKKLNAVYGQPSTSRNNKTQKMTSKKVDVSSKMSSKKVLNNKLEYIPYSQLTLGGVRVSDIEQEISDIPNRNEIPLSPILDKILSSRENSFHKNSPKKNKADGNPRILTTSDENLLQEVIDIEKSVTKTLSKIFIKIKNSDIKSPNGSDGDGSKEADSYADDFEDEKSESCENSRNPVNDTNFSNESPESEVDKNISKLSIKSDGGEYNSQKISKSDVHNMTYTKKSNLSFKHKVDIFEFVHSVDTQDSATQSTSSHKISLKETQTSPRSERCNIHNDLWPSIDPRGEVGQILKLEKDLIKKLIVDEYGDIIEKNITKSSTSKELENTQHNVASSQKNTQTSPSHVKSVMTSPTRTKSRTTSPFTLSVPVDRQTSPMICVTNQEDLRIEIENVEEDLGISINLSSPRFSLRLPQNSREVLSNFEESNNQTPSKVNQNEDNQNKTFRKITASSSSSADADNSSSDISSLGEIKLKLKRRLRKCRISSISDSSSSSVPSQCSSGLQSISILPLRSEGEVSLGQAIRRKNLNKRDSDGEISIKQLS